MTKSEGSEKQRKARDPVRSRFRLSSLIAANWGALDARDEKAPETRETLRKSDKCAAMGADNKGCSFPVPYSEVYILNQGHKFLKF